MLWRHPVNAEWEDVEPFSNAHFFNSECDHFAVVKQERCNAVGRMVGLNDAPIQLRHTVITTHDARRTTLEAD